MRLPLFFAFALATSALSACSSSEAKPPTDSGTTTEDTGGVVDGGSDPLAEKRAACAFGAGSKVEETLGFKAADRAKLPISHVIVVMKENRSFDHYFGRLPKEGRTDIEGIPDGFTNPDHTGAKVAATHETNACSPLDPEHQFANMHAMWNGGKMDGFIENAYAHSSTKDGAAMTDGHFVMTYRERTDLPFYYWLTDQYAMADHWHSSVLSGTWANRLYMYAGQSFGVHNTGSDFVPDGAKSIFDALDAAKVPYAMYSDDFFPLDGAMLNIGYTEGHPRFFKEEAFFDSLADGSLPPVTFIDATENVLDEHPPADIQKGEAWTKKVYDAVTASPLWLKDGKGIAMIWTFDETGGMFEHVAPPTACVANSGSTEFDRMGFRVPFVMISPFAKKKFVSHKTYEHTSITRFIEMVHDLPAMTARDANAEGMLDFFDFTATPNAKPPAAPAAGTGGCK